MPTNLLDTRTVNYLELVGNGRVYEVPPFQRDYSWGEEQWEDLWLDILELRPDRERTHYLGAVVIEARSDRLFRVIDGQQRLATLSLISLAIIQRLESLAEQGIDTDRNRERARGLRARFVGEKDPASLLEQSKLTLNETDNGIYQDYLVQGQRPVGTARLPKSNLLLIKAFDYFAKRLEEDIDLRNEGFRLAELLSETIARGLLFIRITVDDDSSAYTVFETLNARGLELSTTDLLKNHLFSRMTPGDLSHLQRRWRELISNTTAERFPDFLRFHMLCSHSQIRKARLFKMVRTEVRTAPQVLDLMRQLEGRALLFAALNDPTHPFWNDHPEAKPYIKDLSLFRVKQMTPLVFAAKEKLSASTFTQVVRMLMVVSFRYSVVSKLNPSDQESIYSQAAQAVLADRAKTASEVFALLRPIYVPDDKFRQDFANLVAETNGLSKKITRYILLKLEARASGRHVDYETDLATVEHILPENPGEAWGESIPPDAWDTCLHRLGNLTPLESSINRTLGNANYLEKAVAYARSGYSLTNHIPLLAPEDWTIAHIERRQGKLADAAVQIWRCDY